MAAIWKSILAARDDPSAVAGLRSGPASDPLVRLYGPLLGGVRDKPFVIGQLGQSLDGRICTRSGDSFFINGPEGLDHLHRLRALVDVVVVGVGTALSDDPRLTVRRCEGRSPARAIIDPRARLSASSKLLRDRSTELLVFRGPGSQPAPEPAKTVRIGLDGEGCFDPADIVGRLHSLGCSRILVEGGALTVSKFIDCNALDRLHIIMSPVLIGSGRCGLELNPIDKLSSALRPTTSIHVLGDRDVVFDCAFERCGADAVREGAAAVVGAI